MVALIPRSSRQKSAARSFLFVAGFPHPFFIVHFGIALTKTPPSHSFHGGKAATSLEGELMFEPPFKAEKLKRQTL